MQKSNNITRRSYQSSINNMLFVGGLPLEASYSDVANYFSSFGPIHRVDLPTNKNGQRKGFGFIHFKNSSEVESVLRIKFHEIKGKRVALRKALDSTEASHQTKMMQERKIFAIGFQSHITEEEIFQNVSQYGRVVKILSPKGGVGKRGFCYIIMDEKLEFERLVSKRFICIGGCCITLKPASIKSEITESHVQKSISPAVAFRSRASESRNTNNQQTQPKFNNGRIDQRKPFSNDYCDISQEERFDLNHYPSQEESFHSVGWCCSHHPQDIVRSNNNGRDLVNNHYDHQSAYILRGDNQDLGEENGRRGVEHHEDCENHQSSEQMQIHTINDRLYVQPSRRASENLARAPEDEGLRFRINSTPVSYSFKDKYTSKKNLNCLTGIEPVTDPTQMIEIEIIQDINTTITLRNKKQTQAVKAIFEEQTTYYGQF